MFGVELLCFINSTTQESNKNDKSHGFAIECLVRIIFDWQLWAEESYCLAFVLSQLKFSSTNKLADSIKKNTTEYKNRNRIGTVHNFGWQKFRINENTQNEWYNNSIFTCVNVLSLLLLWKFRSEIHASSTNELSNYGIFRRTNISISNCLNCFDSYFF